MHETVFAKHHIAAKAQMVDFAGWHMPVQYSSIVAEHKMVRATGGLFDVSHMGRLLITGPDHVRFTDHVATNGRADMRQGQVRYNLICGESGTIHDDVLISAGLGVDASASELGTPSAMRGDATFIVCNAGNHGKIRSWLGSQMPGFNVAIHDLTSRYAMLALQGKVSEAVLQPHTDVALAKIKYYRFNVGTVFGVPGVMVSRTGYTGEDGFELIFPAEHAELFWGGLLTAGVPHGLAPAGLGARDTLRLEAGMPLYGHEIDDTVNPVEAGLDWAVKLDKEFVGASVLRAEAKHGPKRRLMGLDIDSKRIARQGAAVKSGGATVAAILSGTKSPTLDKVIGTALLPAALAAPGTAVEVEVKEGQCVPATVVALPFYKRAK